MASWFARPINLGITIGAAVMAVVAFVAIVYSVVTHSEPGLLRACWVDDEAYYADTSATEGIGLVSGTCDNPEEIVWQRERIPLKVAWGALRDSDDRGVKAAIRDINAQLGFTMFIETPEGEESDVVIELEVHLVGDTAAPAGWASHAKVLSDEDLCCEVRIRSLVISDRMVFLVIRHELLHAAGLAHDPADQTSIMYPLVRDDTMDAHMGAALITDFDRALLRRLYHD